MIIFIKGTIRETTKVGHFSSLLFKKSTRDHSDQNTNIGHFLSLMIQTFFDIQSLVLLNLNTMQPANQNRIRIRQGLSKLFLEMFFTAVLFLGSNKPLAICRILVLTILMSLLLPLDDDRNLRCRSIAHSQSRSLAPLDSLEVRQSPNLISLDHGKYTHCCCHCRHSGIPSVINSRQLPLNLCPNFSFPG